MQVVERVVVEEAPCSELPRKPRRAWLTLLLRLHLPVVFTGRGLVAAAGLGLGGMCLLAIMLLYQSIGAPFAALDARIHAVAPDAEVVRSRLGTWLPEELLHSLPGADGLVPVTGGFAELTAEGGAEGALVLGGDCRIERLIGEFGCAELADRIQARAGMPGLSVTGRLADSLGAGVGSVVTFPGGQEAAVVDVIRDPRLDGLNDGFLAAGETTSVAELFGHPGQLAAVYAPSPPPGFGGSVQAQLGDQLTASRLTGQTRYMVPVIEQVRRFLLIGGIAAGLTGAFLAGSTLILQNAERKRTIATLDAIGMRPQQSVAGLLCEGAMLGFVGILIAIPCGVLVGWLLVHGYAVTLLRGTGVHVAYQVPWSLVGIVAAGMMVLGCLATIPSIIAFMRQSTSGAISGSANAEGPRQVPLLWSLVPLVGWAASLLLMQAAGGGRLSVEALQAATGLYSLSTMALTVMLAPRLARAVPPLPARWSWAPMLIRSSLTRSPLRTGFTVTIIALGVSLTFGITTVLGSVKASIPAGVGRWLEGDGILLVGRAVGEPTAPALAPEYLDEIRARPEVGRVTPMANLALDSRFSVFGVPADSMAAARIVTGTGLDDATTRAALRSGDVILGRLAANSAGVGVGDMLTVPSTSGATVLRVAGIGTPALADETGLGRVLEIDYDLAVRLWGASATSAFVEPAQGADPAELAANLPRPGRIQLYEPRRLVSDAQSFVDRLYTPFILVGRLALVIAFVGVLNLLLLGLLSRKQERAGLHAVGMSPSQETFMIFGDALMLSGLGGLFGIVGGIVFAWGVLLASPLLLATSPPLRVDLVAVAWSVAVAVVVCALGAVLPAWHMRRLGVPLPLQE